MCKITHNKPSFQDKCKDFILDHVLEEASSKKVVTFSFSTNHKTREKKKKELIKKQRNRSFQTKIKGKDTSVSGAFELIGCWMGFGFFLITIFSLLIWLVYLYKNIANWSTSTVLIYYLIFPVICIINIFIWRSIRKFVIDTLKRRRTNKMKIISEKMEMAFFEKGKHLLSQLNRFRLYWKESSSTRKIENVLKKKIGEAEIAIFDFSYGFLRWSQYNPRRLERMEHEITEGKEKIFQETVFFVKSKALNLPTFFLRTKNLFQKIFSFFYQGIKFEINPEFSKRYLLKATDINKIREIFNKQILDFYESIYNGNHIIITEGFENKLIYYRKKLLVKPDYINSFFEEGFKLFNLFTMSENKKDED